LHDTLRPCPGTAPQSGTAARHLGAAPRCSIAVLHRGAVPRCGELLSHRGAVLLCSAARRSEGFARSGPSNRKALQVHKYLPDPHTAVALSAAWGLYGEGQLNTGSTPPVLVLATASPCKFEESITVAIGADGWKKYSGSQDFPAAARAVLQASERPSERLVAQGSLEASQNSWEQTVRGWLNEARPAARL
jgi:hypothetical protein